jgi:hypothetical protein
MLVGLASTPCGVAQERLVCAIPQSEATLGQENPRPRSPPPLRIPVEPSSSGRAGAETEAVFDRISKEQSDGRERL